MRDSASIRAGRIYRSGSYVIGAPITGESQHSVFQNLSEELDSKLSQLNLGSNGAEEDWAAFRDTVYNTALTHLGKNTRKHQDWFDENDELIKKLLDEKRQAHREFQQDTSFASKKTAFKSIKGKVQAKLREMQDSWLSNKADETRRYADSNNSKRFYDALKAIYGPQSSGLCVRSMSSVQTGPHHSPRRTQSWRDGQSTSTTF
jgi:uncharacterized protein YukE